MKTNIYMMLNEIGTDAEAYPEEGWSETEAKKLNKTVLGRIHKKNKRKKALIGICAAAAFAIAVILPFRGLAVYAMEMLSYRIGAFLGIDKDLTPYEQVVNQSVTKDGVTITLNSVVLDEDELVVSTTETYENKKEKIQGVITGDVYINGVRASSAAGGGARSNDEYTVETVMTYQLDEIDVAQQLNIILNFRDYEENRGGWKFKFSASGEQLAADTQTVELEYQYQLPDGSLVSLTKYTDNAMGQKIYYTKDGDSNDYDMMMKGTDNLGNEVSFYVSTSNKQGGKFVIDNLDGNLSDDADSLTLTPYAVKYPEKSGKMSSDYQKVGEAFTIKLR